MFIIYMIIEKRNKSNKQMKMKIELPFVLIANLYLLLQYDVNKQKINQKNEIQKNI